jgi:signal transduction histidine kinase
VKYRFLEINVYSRRFSRLFTYFEHPSFLVMLYIAAIFFVYGRSPLKSSLYVIIGWIFISVMASLTNERVISTENTRLQEQKREIGHRLKSPIELIRLIANRLKKSQAYSEDDIGRILQKTEELAESVQELLREKIKVEEKKPENLNHILEAIIQRLSPQFEANNVNLTMCLEPELPPVSAVRRKMEEVFSNFIINAIEAMSPKGGGLLEISTADLTPGPSPQACGEGRRMVGIKISDTGIGIPPDKLPMIFKRGYTDKAKGSGNGLYIAKKHIDGLGGGIDVESEVGKGTTFTVILPLYSPLPRMER